MIRLGSSSFRARKIAGLLLFAALAAHCAVAAAFAEITNLLLVGEGSLPIVISAPHGGTTAIPGVSVRTNTASKNFTTLRDTGTAALAEKIAAGLEKSLGGKPFVVIARFDRKFIDANRPVTDGCESEEARPVYEAYHRALSNACGAVLAKWGRGILLDIHGQGAKSNAIIRGTSNGRTVVALTKNFGEPALSGPQSILGQMAGKGYEVVSTIGDTKKEDARYGGGFIVRTYGSCNTNGIDALQCENGAALRNKRNLDRVAADYVEAIAAFYRAYLPPAR